MTLADYLLPIKARAKGLHNFRKKVKNNPKYRKKYKKFSLPDIIKTMESYSYQQVGRVKMPCRLIAMANTASYQAKKTKIWVQSGF